MDVLSREAEIMATSKDVAKLAGVSHTTVSRAFRGDVRLRKETYDRVMAAAAQLQYTPNYLAASLKRQRSNTIGLISPDMSNPFFITVAHKLGRLLEDHGYRLLLAFDDYDYEKQQRAVRTMIGSRAEAIIFTPAAGPEPEYIRNPDLHFIQLFSRRYARLPSLNSADDQGAYIGTRHLLEMGHRRILLCGGANRVGGFQKACGECPDARPDTLLFAGSAEEAEERIAEKIAAHQISAVFAVGDWFAACAYRVIKRLGLRIPEDISFLVFDDLEWTQLLDISTVAQPLNELAETLVQYLLQLLEGGESPSDAVFSPFLIKRNSVKRIAK